jgi:hypothetical protein
LMIRWTSLTTRRIAGVSRYRDLNEATHRRRPPMSS